MFQDILTRFVQRFLQFQLSSSQLSSRDVVFLDLPFLVFMKPLSLMLRTLHCFFAYEQLLDNFSVIFVELHFSILHVLSKEPNDFAKLALRALYSYSILPRNLSSMELTVSVFTTQLNLSFSTKTVDLNIMKQGVHTRFNYFFWSCKAFH